MSVALITGVSGQDGAYLARLLLDHGYQVHGISRKPPADVVLPLPELQGRVVMHQASLLDQPALEQLISRVRPTEIYNLAAQTFVPASWENPLQDAEITGLGPVRLLQAIRSVDPAIRFFQAGSSEVFGAAREEPQSEQTPFRPRSPYAAAKAYAHWLCVCLRERYGLFAVNGILFNHESPLRGKDFVTKKIASAVARIKLGRAEKLRLGNLDSRRDWGFAGDFVRAMWLTLQQPAADDYVIATGRAHSVRELVEIAFRHVDLDWREWVEIDPALVRPQEGPVQRGDIRKAQEKLGWRPTVSFEELVATMVDAELQRESRES